MPIINHPARVEEYINGQWKTIKECLGGDCNPNTFECTTGTSNTPATAKNFGESCVSGNECASGQCSNTYSDAWGETQTVFKKMCVYSLAEQSAAVARKGERDAQTATAALTAAIGGNLIANPIKTLTAANLVDDVTTTIQCIAGNQQACSMVIPTLFSPIPGTGLVDDVGDFANSWNLLTPNKAPTVKTAWWDPIGDTSNFRLTNAPDIQGPILDNNLIVDFYGTSSHPADIEAQRLIKYITGLDYTDPNLPDLLVNDINIIRAKYNLPPRDLLYENPAEYQRQLTTLVQQEAGTTIVPQGERQVFFDDNPLAGGVFRSDDNTITVKYPRFDLYSDNPRGAVISRTDILTHETVHALQNQRYPSMPVEIMEYEAYLTGLGQGWLANSATPANIRDFIFNQRIGGSASWWYKDQGLIPAWINP